MMMYSEAIDAAAKGVADARRFMEVQDSVVVLIAGILGEVYEVETRYSARELKNRIEAVEHGSD